jgi:hypothetical protein
VGRLSRSVVGAIALIGPMGLATAAAEHPLPGNERKRSIRPDRALDVDGRPCRSDPRV